jgi:hypothetical protein
LLDRCSKRRVEHETELAGEALRNAQCDELERAAVIGLAQKRKRLVLHRAGSCVGDEAFGALSRRNRDVSAPIGARLLRHEEDDHSGVARAIARIPLLAHSPLTPDLKRNVILVASSEIPERDDSDLAARLRSDVFDDALNALDRRRWNDSGEVGHKSLRSRDRNLLRQRERQRDETDTYCVHSFEC